MLLVLSSNLFVAAFLNTLIQVEHSFYYPYAKVADGSLGLYMVSYVAPVRGMSCMQGGIHFLNHFITVECQRTISL